MDEFKEYSQGFDAFEKIAAKFQENPLEFKRQFTSDSDQFTSDSDQSFLQVLGDKLGDKLGEFGKLLNEYNELEKQGGKPDEIIRCIDSIIELDFESINFVAGFDNPDTTSDTNITIKKTDLDVEFLFIKGKICFELEKPEEALKCADKIIELNHKNAGGWGNKGNALGMLGK